MTWETHPLAGSLGPWRQDWDRLNNLLYRGNPFFDSRFVEPLLAHFASGRERLCVHRRRGRIDGLLILEPRHTGTWTSFLPSQAQAAPVLVENPEVLDALFGALPGWAWRIELLSQDPDYSTVYRLADTRVLDWSDHNLTINISLSGKFESYWNARSKNLQKNLKRYINRSTNASHPPLLVQHTSKLDVLAGLERYGQLESAGWKGNLGTAIHRHNEQGSFYRDVLSGFADLGDCSVYELYIGNRLVASRLCVACDEMVVILKTTYDESQSAFAPGRLLLYFLLREEFQLSRCNSVEFYTNATQDQLQWCTGQRHIRHLTLYRNSLAQRLAKLQRYITHAPRSLSLPPLHEFSLDSKLPRETQSHSFQEFSPLAALPAACDTLFLQVGQGVFDLTPQWFGLLAKTTLAEPQVASYRVLVKAGEAEAILPLILPFAGKSRKVTGLSNFYSTLYRPILRDGLQAADLASILRFIARDARANTLRFDAMDPEHPSFALLEEALRQAGMWPFRFFCFGNWYLRAEGLDWEAYMKQLPSKHRNTLKRLGRKFEEEVEGHFRIYTGKDGEVEEALAAYQGVYASSWKVPEPFPDFIPEFVRMSAQLGWLRMGVAYSGRQPVAAQFWLVLGGKASIYKVAYDDKFSAYSPGSLLTGQLMRHVLDTEHVREVDFLMGDDAYKRIWMSHRRERWGIVAYNPRTFLGQWLAAREALTRAAKPAITRLWERLQHK